MNLVEALTAGESEADADETGRLEIVVAGPQEEMASNTKEEAAKVTWAHRGSSSALCPTMGI